MVALIASGIPACCSALASDGDGGAPQDWSANIIVVAVTAIALCISVLLHYEALSLLSTWLFRLEGRRRRRVLVVIFGVLGAHVAEIWVFGAGYALLLLSPALGSVHGVAGGMLDLVYVSSVTFTTVGAADVHLLGPIRFLAGSEALAGLILVTWSASFTFLEMGRFWRDR